MSIFIPKCMPGSFLAALRYDPKCERNTLGYFRASAGKSWYDTIHSVISEKSKALTE